MKRILLCVFLLASSAGASEFGDCSGEIDARWLDDGRKMELLSDYSYTDSGLTEWLAPEKSVVDGASIPKFLWSLIGGPFEGKYRNASVVHDVACDEEAEEWKRVHRMFYEACRCSGVGALKAKIMYAAVYHFGPRWESAQVSAFLEAEENPEQALAQFRQMQAYLEQYPDVSLEQVEALTPLELVSFSAEGTDLLDLREPDN